MRAESHSVLAAPSGSSAIVVGFRQGLVETARASSSWVALVLVTAVTTQRCRLSIALALQLQWWGGGDERRGKRPPRRRPAAVVRLCALSGQFLRGGRKGIDVHTKAG